MSYKKARNSYFVFSYINDEKVFYNGVKENVVNWSDNDNCFWFDTYPMAAGCVDTLWSLGYRHSYCEKIEEVK